MGLNDTASAERLHIGFFGRRNAGKSSLVNAVTGQQLSVVSEIAGTTTDPVQKAMELLPLGPVVILDTPGLDDEGTLGTLRVQRAMRMLDKTDLAVLVVDAARGLQEDDRQLLALLEQRKLPHLIAYNKCDLPHAAPEAAEPGIAVSAVTGENISALKEAIAHLAPDAENGRQLLDGLVSEGDRLVLVVPIDSAAPKGRLILPQQQTLRAILDAGAVAAVTRETELAQTLQALREKPRLVITDSQAFAAADRATPPDVALTSFSILFARYKGSLTQTVRGAQKLDTLRDGDTILISEGCTHHRQCQDIGTVKLPAALRAHSGRSLQFAFTSGGEFPDTLSQYALVVHCGGCMLNEREMRARLSRCAAAGVPVTNYGIAFAHLRGILPRALAPFPRDPATGAFL